MLKEESRSQLILENLERIVSSKTPQERSKSPKDMPFILKILKQ